MLKKINDRAISASGISATMEEAKKNNPEATDIIRELDAGIVALMPEAEREQQAAEAAAKISRPEMEKSTKRGKGFSR